MPNQEAKSYVCIRIVPLVILIPILVWTSMKVHWFLHQTVKPITITVTGVSDYYGFNDHSGDDRCIFCRYRIDFEFTLNQTIVQGHFVDRNSRPIGQKELRYYNVNNPSVTYSGP